jgi:hypothetical protein
MRSYFRKRRVFIKSKYKSASKTMQKSCPQGSIIGPLMWNYCMDTLLCQLENEISEDEAEAVAFADDLVMILKGDSRSNLERVGCNVLQLLNEWCKLHKLSVSASKTKAMLLKGRLNKERMPKLCLDNVKIKFVSEVRYLGIIIDNKMNFVAHVKQLREKLVGFTMAIRRVAKEEWGLKKKVLKILYRAVIIPIATYGAAFWWDKVAHSMVRRHLLAAQRAILLVLTRACRTTSTGAMQVVGGTFPLDLEVIRKGLINNVRRNATLAWNNYRFESKDDLRELDAKEEQRQITSEV